MNQWVKHCGCTITTHKIVLSVHYQTFQQVVPLWNVDLSMTASLNLDSRMSKFARVAAISRLHSMKKNLMLMFVSSSLIALHHLLLRGAVHIWGCWLDSSPQPHLQFEALLFSHVVHLLMCDCSAGWGYSELIHDQHDAHFRQMLYKSLSLQMIFQKSPCGINLGWNYCMNVPQIYNSLLACFN